MNSSFLKVENLSKNFGGIRALHNISFEIGRNEIVGLIGPNGAGKSTLLRIIMGILKPDSGRLLFRGKEFTKNKPWRTVANGIAGTFQVVKPFRGLPVITNVIVACLSQRAGERGEWVKRIETKALDALEFVGISDLAFERASSLSHGDLKRLEIARAIATEPELLLLDEPFGGLSPAETALLAKSIQRLHKGGRFGRLHNEGPAILIVEHKLPELLKIIDRVIVINFGEIIAIGTPQEIVRDRSVMKAYTGKEELTIAS